MRKRSAWSVPCRRTPIDHPSGVLTRAHFQDNTGTEAGDLWLHSLDAMNMTVGRPSFRDSTPRMVLSKRDLSSRGQPSAVGRRTRTTARRGAVHGQRGHLGRRIGRTVDLRYSNSATRHGALQHLTLAKLVGPEERTGELLSNGSEVLIENSALVHFSEPVAYQDSTLEENRNFVGPLVRSRTALPLGARPNPWPSARFATHRCGGRHWNSTGHRGLESAIGRRTRHRSLRETLIHSQSVSILR